MLAGPRRMQAAYALAALIDKRELLRGEILMGSAAPCSARTAD
jgi:hypothetical protein